MIEVVLNHEPSNSPSLQNQSQWISVYSRSTTLKLCRSAYQSLSDPSASLNPSSIVLGILLFMMAIRWRKVGMDFYSPHCLAMEDTAQGGEKSRKETEGVRMDAGRNVPIGTLMLPFGAFP